MGETKLEKKWTGERREGGGEQADEMKEPVFMCISFQTLAC